MRYFGGKVIAAAMVACAVIALVSPSVNASEEPLPPAVVGVLDRLAATGWLTDADREVLRQHPDVAAQVGDPGRVTTSGDTVPVDPAASPAAVAGVAATRCWVTTHAVNGYTALGFSAYKFHHQVDWCENGSQVLGMHFRNGWATELEATMYWKGITQNVASPTPNWEASSFFQAGIENCILKYGCVRTNYPWSRHTLRGNGNVSTEWGH